MSASRPAADAFVVILYPLAVSEPLAGDRRRNPGSSLLWQNDSSANAREIVMSRIQSLRSELGGVHPLAESKVKDHLEPFVKAFIGHAPFAVLASSNASGDCDASPKGGKPGFVKVLDDRTLLIPDVGGNRLFQSYENFESNPKAGLVFIIPGTEVTTRVNGRVEVVDAARLQELELAAEVQYTDGNSELVQAILLHVDEAYFHCPRAFRFADLWNTATIEENGKRSLKDLLGG
jgi:uncharacterized protein